MNGKITIDASVLQLCVIITGFIVSIYQAWLNMRIRAMQHEEQMIATSKAINTAQTAADASGRAEMAANHLNEKINTAQLSANAAQATADGKQDSHA